jgi:hypothetical protein
MDNSIEIPPIAVVGILLAILEDDEEEEILVHQEKNEELALGALIAKRELEGVHNFLPKAKRLYIRYDWERARLAVYNNYFGVTPIFQYHQFARYFRVTKLMAQLLLETCSLADCFFL